VATLPVIMSSGDGGLGFAGQLADQQQCCGVLCSIIVFGCYWEAVAPSLGPLWNIPLPLPLKFLGLGGPMQSAFLGRSAGLYTMWHNYKCDNRQLMLRKPASNSCLWSQTCTLTTQWWTLHLIKDFD